MPRAEPGWGSPPRGSEPRGPCSPAGSVGEYNIAVLICALQEGDTGMLLPVSHGLPEDCPLAACGRISWAVALSSEWELGALSPTDTVLQPVRRHTAWPGGCAPAKGNKAKARYRLTAAHSPVKFPPITNGMTPSGHTRSGLDVAARLLRGLPLHLPLLSLCGCPLVP
jgi:hypothetical protein